ncbi:hypothetical protein PspLS_03294 [Pyricularia sp. CBS 133598]|nr:hypothetical protein PspLS_03294 [Pyricularia sp. CBS 133598]
MQLGKAFVTLITVHAGIAAAGRHGNVNAAPKKVKARGSKPKCVVFTRVGDRVIGAKEYRVGDNGYWPMLGNPVSYRIAGNCSVVIEGNFPIPPPYRVEGQKISKAPKDYNSLVVTIDDATFERFMHFINALITLVALYATMAAAAPRGRRAPAKCLVSWTINGRTIQTNIYEADQEYTAVFFRQEPLYYTLKSDCTLVRMEGSHEAPPWKLTSVRATFWRRLLHRFMPRRRMKLSDQEFDRLRAEASKKGNWWL